MTGCEAGSIGHDIARLTVATGHWWTRWYQLARSDPEAFRACVAALDARGGVKQRARKRQDGGDSALSAG